MGDIYSKTGKKDSTSKPVYIYDEKLGWVNVTMFLDNLKNVMNTHKRNIKRDYNLIRLYYSSC